MNRNEKTEGRLRMMAQDLRNAGVATRIDTDFVNGRIGIEWVREDNGYEVERGYLSIMTFATGNYRFVGGAVLRFGSIRKIKTWNEARSVVNLCIELATYEAQAVSA